MVERFTMSGDDMRTYRCRRRRKEHIVDFGIATWKRLSDARNSESENAQFRIQEIARRG